LEAALERKKQENPSRPSLLDGEKEARLIAISFQKSRPGVEPAEALRMRKQLEIHYTLKHGSWLNIAEIEWSIFTRQCLDRRMPSMAILRQKANQWGQERNRRQKSVDC